MKNTFLTKPVICLAVLFCVFNTPSSAQIDLYLRYKSKIDSLKKGMLKLPFEHEKLVWVNERGACFQLPGGKRGVCTLDGRVYIPAQFSAIHTVPHYNFFAENFETKKWGVLDSTGHELIPLLYDEVEDVSDYYGEYAPLIKCKTDKKWAFFDLKGNKLTEHIYLKVFWRPVAPEVLIVQNAHNKWQFLNLKGQPASAWEFDDLEYYANGLVVEKDKKIGFFTYQGTQLTELKYRDAYGFKDVEDAKAKAESLGLPKNLTLVGSADIFLGNTVWIDSAGGEHPINGSGRGKAPETATEMAVEAPPPLVLVDKVEEVAEISAPAPEPAKQPTGDAVVIYPQKSAEFPGGESALRKYLKDNLQYPAVAKEAKIQGAVVISFVVEKNGSITNIVMSKDIGGGCGKEAVRMVSSMPNWYPAMQDGNRVRSVVALSVPFEL